MLASFIWTYKDPAKQSQEVLQSLQETRKEIQQLLQETGNERGAMCSCGLEEEEEMAWLCPRSTLGSDLWIEEAEMGAGASAPLQVGDANQGEGVQEGRQLAENRERLGHVQALRVVQLVPCQRAGCLRNMYECITPSLTRRIEDWRAVVAQ